MLATERLVEAAILGVSGFVAMMAYLRGVVVPRRTLERVRQEQLMWQKRAEGARERLERLRGQIVEVERTPPRNAQGMLILARKPGRLRDDPSPEWFAPGLHLPTTPVRARTPAWVVRVQVDRDLLLVRNYLGASMRDALRNEEGEGSLIGKVKCMCGRDDCGMVHWR